MKRNNARFDLSEYLIHFVRWIKVEDNIKVGDNLDDVDLDLDEDTPPLPENWGWDDDIEERDGFFIFLSPFFLLRTIVRQGHIWATWARRGKERTVYGPRPAVCFTEMPLGAFIQSGRAREANNEKMSPLGIVLPKSQLFALGARPVIYGLSSVPRPTPGADGTRALPDSALPPKEQYRYVAYNPTSSRGPDWTHEREWRWPLRAKQLPTAADYPARVRDIPGLDLYRPKAQIRGAGVIVQSKRQAHLITHDLLRIADQGTVPVGTFDFILILDALPPAEKLRDPVSVKKAIEASTVSLSEFMSPTTSDDLLVQKFRQVVSKVASSGPTPECGEFGGCWLWLRDNTHPMARALLRADQIDLSKAGRYLVRLPEFQDWNLSQKRDMADRLAALVARVFKIPCLSFRVSGTEDPDGLPFHCDDTDDGGIFYNSAWSEGDL